MRRSFLLSAGLVLVLLGGTPGQALVGQVLSLDGHGDYVEIADSPSLYSREELTLSAWFRPDLMDRTWQVLMWKGDAPKPYPLNNREYSLMLNGDGFLELSSTALDNRWHRITTPAQIEKGQWFHVAAVISARENAMRIFIDGELAATGMYDTSGVKDAGGPLRLGNLPEREHFAGLIDEVRIWNRALTRTEILHNMNRPLESEERGLLAHYAFDSFDEEGQVEDLSGNGNSGRLAGEAHLKQVRVFMPPISFKRGEVESVSDSAAVVSQEKRIDGEAAALLIQSLSSVESEDMMVRSSTPQPHVAAVPPRRVEQGRPWRADDYRGWEHKWYAPRNPFGEVMDLEGLQLIYNRVQGLYAGYHLPRTYHKGTGLANFGELGFSFNNEEWRYQLGVELFAFYSPSSHWDWNLASIGAEVHDLTDSQDGWLLPREENSMDVVLFRRDFYDYYRRQGGSVYAAHNFGGVLHTRGQVTRDEFTSLENQVDWILLGNRFAAEAFRANPRIDEGEILSLRVDVQLDTRDRRIAAQRGWFINTMIERAGGFLQGDHQFKRYLMDARRYQPLDRGSRLDLRLRLGTAKGSLPRQYLYDIGGFGSLRGYGFKEFTGDRMVLFNAEYWIDGDKHWGQYWPGDEFDVGAFFDAGSAWFARDRSAPFDGLNSLVGAEDSSGERDIKTSMGFAIGLDDLRLDMARPLDGREDDWTFSLRFSRTF